MSAVIKGTITTDGGVETEFTITELGWNQWGGVEREVLGTRVDVLDAIEAALVEAGFFADPEDEEEEPAPEDPCRNCGEEIDWTDISAGYDMCGSCLHNAVRSGWDPSEESQA